MINKSLSLFLGITLSLGVLATETLAYPRRTRVSPSPGIHRTITAPNRRIGNNYSRGNSYYRGRGNYPFRERVVIQRNLEPSLQKENLLRLWLQDDKEEAGNRQGYRLA